MRNHSGRGLPWPYRVEPVAAPRLATLFLVGRRVRGRIIAKLAREKYLLRLRGYHFVAQSSAPLDEGESITAVVCSSSPQVLLQLVDEEVDDSGAAGQAPTGEKARRRRPGELQVQIDIRV